MKDHIGPEGHFFFLGSGSIEAEGYYFYYYELPDGGKMLDKIPADQTTVYEEENRTDGFIEKYIGYYNYTGRVTFTWFDHPIDIKRSVGDYDVKYKVYIPEGSITRDFNLDLE